MADQLELALNGDIKSKADALRPVVYFSGPLTWYAKNSSDRLEMVRQVAQVVATSLNDEGFHVHVPHRGYVHLGGHGAYLENRSIIARSALVVAFYDYPSTGLGQELEIAAAYMRPIVLLVNERRDNVSTMVSGGFFRFKKLDYTDLAEIAERLPPLAREVVDESTPIEELARSRALGQTIRKRRETSGMSRAELAARAGCSVSLIQHLETDEAKVLSPTLVQLAGISIALGLGEDGLLASGEYVEGLPERIVEYAASHGHPSDIALRVLRLAARTDSSDDLNSDEAIGALFEVVKEYLPHKDPDG